MNSQQSYYQSLNLPSFAPPSEIFGIVWPILYVLIIVAFGFTIVQIIKGRWSRILLVPIVINIISNALYSPLFFTWRQPLLATIDVYIVVGSLLWFMVLMRGRKLWPVFTLLPYLAWTSFAAVLQTTIWLMNR